MIQTGVPGSTSASVVPPNPPHVESAGYRARAGVPPIVTNMTPGLYSPPPNGHSNNSSLSSASEAMDRAQGSHSSLSDGHGHHDEGHGRRVIPRSPATAGHPQFHSQHLAPPHGLGASASTPSLQLPLEDEGTYRAGPSSAVGNYASTAFASGSGHASGSNQVASSSRQAELGVDDIDLSGMDPETAALVLQIHREEVESRRQEEARVAADERMALQEQESERLQEEARVRADERIALQEQESEREAWQLTAQSQAEGTEAQVRAEDAQAVSFTDGQVLDTAYDHSDNC